MRTLGPERHEPPGRERREPEPSRLMDLVKVGRADNQAEAEFLQGLLLEEGVPSVVQRGQGSDVPDFLAAGARDLLVSRENAQVARDVLLQGDVVSPRSGSGAVDRPLRVLVGLLIALAIVAAVAWVGTECSPRSGDRFRADTNVLGANGGEDCERKSGQLRATQIA